MTQCGVCEAPQPDGAHLCTRHLDDYLHDIAAIDTVLDTLQPTVERTDVNGDSVGSSGHKTAPAPVNLDAMAAKANLILNLRTTGRRILTVYLRAWESKQHLPRPILPGNDKLSVWLLHHRELIRMAYWAPGAARELHQLLEAAQHAAERRQPKVFAGTCTFAMAHPDTPDEPVVCGTELFALPGDHEARCDTCGSTYEVQAWRAHGKTAAEYAILAPAPLSRALGGYGLDIKPARIRTWASRGLITRANPDHDEDGRPIAAMYRLGDALDTYQNTQITKHARENHV